MKPWMKHFGTAALAFTLALSGCATPPFKPASDIRIASVSSGEGRDEIQADASLLKANSFPYQPAVIQFSLNNGVGVTITDLDIDYSPSSGESIVYKDSNGAVQTGIPGQKNKVQRHFDATIPFTELGLSEAGLKVDGTNVGTGATRVCCIFFNLVTRKAFEILSVDGDLNTLPNYGSNVIANLTIRGIDDNDNAFTRKAAIAVSTNLVPGGAEFDPGCDANCSIGSKPAQAESSEESSSASGSTSGAASGN